MADDRLDSIIETYLLRQEAGEVVDESHLLAAHPDLAEELAAFFDMHRRARSAVEGPWNQAITDAEPSPPIEPGPLSESGPPSEPSPPSPPSEPSPLSERATIAWNGSSGSTSGESVWSWGRVEGTPFPVRFGAYDLRSEIKRGGMGIVYEAIHRDLNRVVALKVIRAGELATDEEVLRFRTEAIAASALSHPNILPIFESGEAHGLVYFTMPYVDGDDLERWLADGPMDPIEAAKILLKVTEAVACAHRKNIIHRDLKPSNILVDRAGEPYLVDFGLARLQAADGGLTMTGQVMGTPAYMAPEQATGHGHRVTAAVDVYGLGAVLYAMLTQRPPFSGPTPFDILMQVLDRQPPSPSQLVRGVPRDLEAICLAAMAKDPDGRYASADALAEDLRRFLKGEPVVIHQPTVAQRVALWWRREPVLVSHLAALGAVGLIMVASYLLRSAVVPTVFAVKFVTLVVWIVASVVFQRLALLRPGWRDRVYLGWATTDVTIYTWLIYIADPPRGLLLVGYPMMIAATGLFYRVRFVTFVTAICCVGVVLLARTVDDPLAERLDFLGIYLSGLMVLGLCVATMIRRVRRLSRFYGESE